MGGGGGRGKGITIKLGRGANGPNPFRHLYFIATYRSKREREMLPECYHSFVSGPIGSCTWYSLFVGDNSLLMKMAYALHWVLS